ncbi:polysaccharide biosynthesis/export family protein [Thalassomonas sp. M1454]|uniref:polysaccharide biosynthesis/export family protein n=1 Tax=Thalassomonas sp. M1454 TaxID=2594477 RepID=UPI00117FCE07|nr:polysaccharide biosynthesis/export family protein [Thalassomonas sp. M1454]TRX56973.1 polysaccharide export protein [Thalassomonas sp. M1454]
MINKILFLILFFVSHCAIAEDAYRVEPGDTIKITVFGEDDLSKQLMLENSGEVTYPFLGVLPIKGLTVFQIEQLIFNGLKGDYLIYPHVSVEVVKYRPFYIKGDVQIEGSYSYKPGLNVGQAMVIAGGSITAIEQNEFYILSNNGGNNTFEPVNFSSRLNAGDIVIIENKSTLQSSSSNSTISDD